MHNFPEDYIATDVLGMFIRLDRIYKERLTTHDLADRKIPEPVHRPMMNSYAQKRWSPPVHIKDEV